MYGPSMFSRLRRIMRPVTLSSGLVIVLRIKRVSANTQEQYRRGVGSLIDYMAGDIRVTAITPDHIAGWFAWIQNRPNLHKPNQPISYTTVYYHARALRAYFNTLVDAGHLPVSPFTLKLSKPVTKRVKSIAPEDIDKLLRATRNIRDQAIILALRDSGCRVNALVDMSVERLAIQQSGNNWYGEADVYDEKINERLILHFQDRAARTLHAYSLSRPFNAPDAYWLNYQGEPLSISGVRQMLKRLSKKAGVVRANPHSFRHAKVQRMLKNGAPQKAVQDALGWKSAAMLQIYVQSTPEDVRHYNESWDNFGTE